MSIALSDETITNKFNDFNSDTKFLNYALPTEWFAAEIPLNSVQLTKGHKSPANYNQNLYKVILTKADMPDGVNISGKDILASVYLREPIAEFWVDLSTYAVIKVLDIPEDIKYRGVPVAVY